MKTSKNNSTPTISIILLTRNLQAEFDKVLKMIFCQKIDKPFEVIVIDSGSDSSILEKLKQYPIRLVKIKKEEFGHGKTRNLGARLSNGKYLVYLTQDAIPADKYWLTSLIKELEDEKIAGIFGRQLHQKHANPLTVYFQNTMYPDYKIVKYLKGSRLILKDIFFSNVNSAIRKDVWEKHNFDENLIMSEDQKWAKDVILDNYIILYEPEAKVYHSHNYNLISIFKRNFDSGFSLRDIIDDRISDNIIDGIKYVSGEISFLIKRRKFIWLFYLFIYEFSRSLGFLLGQRASFIPFVIKRKLSFHKDYWDNLIGRR
jgi:rhamnosyltransferase